MFQTINRKCLQLGMAAAALFAAGSLHAATVDYTTTATFTCTGCSITGNGTGNVVVTYFGTGTNTATLTFTGAPAGTEIVDDGSGSGAGYGIIKSGQSNGTGLGNGATINGTMTLTVDQTIPNMGSLTGSFPTATLSGLINDGHSTAFANFGSQNPSFSLGGPVTYELDTSKKTGGFGYTIIAPTSGFPKATTSFQGTITATPEPTFLTLTGAGFIGLAGIALRRRRSA